MQNLHNLAQEAQQAGVTVMMVCSFCPSESDGELTVDDGSGNIINVPICEKCVGVLQSRYAEKFDTPE